MIYRAQGPTDRLMPHTDRLLLRENAVDVKNLRKMQKIKCKRLSCILFSLHSNFKTL